MSRTDGRWWFQDGETSTMTTKKRPMTGEGSSSEAGPSTLFTSSVRIENARRKWEESRRKLQRMKGSGRCSIQSMPPPLSPPPSPLNVMAVAKNDFSFLSPAGKTASASPLATPPSWGALQNMEEIEVLRNELHFISSPPSISPPPITTTATPQSKRQHRKSRLVPTMASSLYASPRFCSPENRNRKEVTRHHPRIRPTVLTLASSPAAPAPPAASSTTLPSKVTAVVTHHASATPEQPKSTNKPSNVDGHTPTKAPATQSAPPDSGCMSSEAETVATETSPKRKKTNPVSGVTSTPMMTSPQLSAFASPLSHQSAPTLTPQSALSGETVSQDSTESGTLTYRERLIAVLSLYNPSKVSKVDEILDKFKGKEEQVIAKILSKFQEDEQKKKKKLKQKLSPSSLTSQSTSPSSTPSSSVNATPRSPSQLTTPLPNTTPPNETLAVSSKPFTTSASNSNTPLFSFGTTTTLSTATKSTWSTKPFTVGTAAPFSIGTAGTTNASWSPPSIQTSFNPAKPLFSTGTKSSTPQASLTTPTPGYRDRLVEFYQKHNPSKLSTVDAVLSKYKGREEEMFDRLRAKYTEESGVDGILPPPPPVTLEESDMMPRCFLDLGVGGVPVGRVVVRLFHKQAPLASENFRCLCTGEKGKSPRSGLQLSFRDSCFHRVVPGFVLQGGDFTKGDGTGGESIYAPGTPNADMWGKFKDDRPFMRHCRRGLLSMANNGADRNGSQFFVTLRPLSHLDGKHVVFGDVISGMDDVVDVVMKTVNLPEGSSKPTNATNVTVLDCGQLDLNPKPPSSGPMRLSIPAETTAKAPEETTNCDAQSSDEKADEEQDSISTVPKGKKETKGNEEKQFPALNEDEKPRKPMAEMKGTKDSEAEITSDCVSDPKSVEMPASKLSWPNREGSDPSFESPAKECATTVDQESETIGLTSQAPKREAESGNGARVEQTAVVPVPSRQEYPCSKGGERARPQIESSQPPSSMEIPNAQSSDSGKEAMESNIAQTAVNSSQQLPAPPKELVPGAVKSKDSRKGALDSKAQLPISLSQPPSTTTDSGRQALESKAQAPVESSQTPSTALVPKTRTFTDPRKEPLDSKAQSRIDSSQPPSSAPKLPLKTATTPHSNSKAPKPPTGSKLAAEQKASPTPKKTNVSRKSPKGVLNTWNDVVYPPLPTKAPTAVKTLSRRYVDKFLDVVRRKDSPSAAALAAHLPDTPLNATMSSDKKPASKVNDAEVSTPREVAAETPVSPLNEKRSIRDEVFHTPVNSPAVLFSPKVSFAETLDAPLPGKSAPVEAAGTDDSNSMSTSSTGQGESYSVEFWYAGSGTSEFALAEAPLSSSRYRTIFSGTLPSDEGKQGYSFLSRERTSSHRARRPDKTEIAEK